MQDLLEELAAEYAAIQKGIERLQDATTDDCGALWRVQAQLSIGEAYGHLRAARAALGKA